MTLLKRTLSKLHNNSKEVSWLICSMETSKCRPKERHCGSCTVYWGINNPSSIHRLCSERWRQKIFVWKWHPLHSALPCARNGLFRCGCRQSQHLWPCLQWGKAPAGPACFPIRSSVSCISPSSPGTQVSNCVCFSLRHVWLLAPMDCSLWAPLSMEFSRQE